ncbi:protease pro-enzyme activation domain-containing protein [Granulicella tundricola]|uniref:Peptidase S53 propeptide n=1 Tax=Granulicella tundricola (strain ATCC BAA-1859 / DSM 23138 / MP5ACTX9) TaxID=1198114 RepID=E8WV79_GRATM|nr:protease pro-enzyme activation domain-containing protein [Granulicella tundricola]ADW67254.1 Peptidase S53 propeptide [Granulicella tundricola MP5ACTX9]
MFPSFLSSLRSAASALPSRLPLQSSLLALSLLSVCGTAQTLKPRITQEINAAQRVTLAGSRNPRALAADDTGSLASGTKLEGMSVVFRRTEAQEADLQALLAAQQNPASPLYHQWLSPEQFGTRFGLSASDQAKVSAWLEQQGFTVDGVSRSGNRISFSGTAGKVGNAFGSELHNFTKDGETHFAPASEVSVPAALSDIIQDVTNLSSFRPKARVKLRPAVVDPNFTSSQSGSHFLTPKDVATIYDINAAYSAGYTGTGQSIVAVGQSAVVLSDIENFQTAAGLTVKDPTVILVPGSGSSTVKTDDESESDLDLEYSGGIAKGATIYFVYTGNNTNYGAFDALQYAITNKIAPIISVSYGTCETNFSATSFAAENAMLAQAAAQGQTVVAAAGDAGSTDCSGTTILNTTQQEALAVDFPSDSQYVTGMGGTEFPTADITSSNSTYWTASSGTDVIGSALSYIPEQVWNDDSASNGILSGGGGVSIFTPRPTWQTGVTGIPTGSFRLTPDISLDSAVVNAPYLYCSSDTATKITGSCSNGFRDSTNTNLTAAGGTSFAAPIFSGMLALINQKLNSTGQGVINPTLYTLAANSTTYARAFHDITSGTNSCTAGSTLCSTAGASAYAATTGYDQATGLGSVDLYNLLTAWPTTTGSTLLASTTTLSAVTTTPVSGAGDVITITVAPSTTSLTTSPTGTVSIAVDGATVSSSAALTSGVATYTFSSTTVGSHIVTATYSGDSIYASSTGSVTLTVGTTATGTGTILLSATNLTVTGGATGTSTITVTPGSGYTGTVSFTVLSSASLPYACYTPITNATVTGTAAVTTALTISTGSASCVGAAVVRAGGKRSLASLSPSQVPGTGESHTKIVLAGLMLFGLCGCRSRRLRKFAPVLLLAGFGLALSGCGSGSGSTTSTTNNLTAKGTYTLTIIGTDVSNALITSTTSLTLTVD